VLADLVKHLRRRPAALIDPIVVAAGEAVESLAAGRPVRPSLDTALYLVSKGQYRVGGAVFMAFIDHVRVVESAVQRERNRIGRAYQATVAADGNRRRSAEKAVYEVLGRLESTTTSFWEMTNGKIVEKTLFELKKVNRRASVRTVQRYVAKYQSYKAK
jgi:hypothetical protein